MGKIVVTEFVSIDGVIEDPGGAEDYEHGGWTFAFDRGPEGNQFKLDELLEAEVQLFGRKTYESFAAAWPSREDEPGLAAFAKRINSMPKYVYSATMRDPTWSNTTVLTGDLAETVGKLKADVDGVILVAGSAALVRGLLDNDLLDELRLMVFPIVLGSGKRLFDGSGKRRLRLNNTKTVGDGVEILVYERA